MRRTRFRDWNRRSWLLLLFTLLAVGTWIPQAAAGGGMLEIRNGYFWDPTTGKPFVPRGVAYQSWNPPVGANQSFNQVDYDLLAFKKIHANSVRAEMVWNVVETAPGVYDWSKPDHLVAQAEALGLKLFILIGFNYAPSWFPDEWRALNAQNQRSFVLNYEHPEARQTYSNYISQVVSRYRNSRAIGGWILGNEYAYFDLWEPARLYLGYDTLSQTSFRNFLRDLYQNDLARANATWGTSYASFDVVPMPRTFPPGRDNALFMDLIRWRKHSIGEYVAVGARAARQADPNHLLTYSMIGGLFGDEDVYYTCEDGRTIVEACRRAGAPLDFWSINNYAIATLSTEIRATDFGIAKHQAETGLPILITETGHTDAESLAGGAINRQGAALVTQMWETLLSGTMGFHIFTWNDRNFYEGSFFAREKGFGFVGQNRLPKAGVFDVVAAAFQKMDELDVSRLLGSSQQPKPDIGIFWSQASDIGWPRANQELMRLWSTLKRLGYQPEFIRDEEFNARGWTNFQALMLSRSFQLDPAHLDTLAGEVVGRGIHVHAAGDPPGQFDAHHKPNPRWRQHMNTLFGVDVLTAAPGLNSGALTTTYATLNFSGASSLGPLPANYSSSVNTWLYWNGINPQSGTTVVKHSGNKIGLHVRDLGTARTALTPLALGEVQNPAGTTAAHNWHLRYQWLQAIYRNHFRITPILDLTGPGAEWIYPDFRRLNNGSVLVGLFNGHTNSATATVRSPGLLAGKTIENLTDGGIVETQSDGEVTLTLLGDQYILLYATDAPSQSVVNPSPVKLWFESAPSSIWPGSGPVSVTVGYDTQDGAVPLSLALESEDLSPGVLASSTPVQIAGKGSITLQVTPPDLDINRPAYRSSRDGGAYRWRASTAASGGTKPGEIRLPVRLVWSAKPTSLPTNPRPGSTYQIPVAWEELPGFLPGEEPTTIDRADLWDSTSSGRQWYAIVLEARSGTTVVARQEFATRQATGTHTFSMAIPGNAGTPITWVAFARTADGASRDVFDSFEGRRLGAETSQPAGSTPILSPWIYYDYGENTPPGALHFDTGTLLEGSHGSQAAFLIYTNPPNVGSFSGFGVLRVFNPMWSLPPFPFGWSQYSFSCDVRERNGRAMDVDLQLKSPNLPEENPGVSHAIQAVIPYESREGNWQRIQARLDQFTQPTFLARFDPNNVLALVINFEMKEKGVVYEVQLDNISWDGPEVSVPGSTLATYLSTNDSPLPPPDADGDGLPDSVETGTGVFVSPSNTGTRPNLADSDGDGQTDGEEVDAGTNPNSALDHFRIESIRWSESGLPILSWKARTGRHYSLSFADEVDAPEFFPVPEATDLTVTSDQVLEVQDAGQPPTTARFYRLKVRTR